MIDVIVTGSAGRMGREVVRAVSAEHDMRVVAAVDPGEEGVVLDGSEGTIKVGTDLEPALVAGRVLVDFTAPSVVEGNVRAALAAGVHCVVGTTGVSEGRWREVMAETPSDSCLFIAPNFAVGAVLMMRFATEAARFMPHVEIIELHHDRKLDAPSGTAMRTAQLISGARAADPVVPGRDTEVEEGARGAVVEGVHVHSVRLPGLVAHQEVLFGGEGQTLSIRHDSIDRTSFMPGVVLAVREVGKRSGLVVGLEALMGL
ncbi:MAG: 4-hydroxy-tetrahydrodipicolinate reductase [Coriobacteriia bacterium]|nr:4-hydroxy-tetrahydrodipicolinate reductase [Coriobacteriia bacterium]